MKNNTPNIVFVNQDYNSTVSAALLAEFNLLQQQHAGKKINIALSGGTTPLPVLELLSRQNLDWERYNFFMVDERCVPQGDAASNYGNISKSFFDHISASGFAMYADDNADSSIVAYRKLIAQHVPKNNGFPVFDLILLGLGDDGHTASLFPGTSALTENTQTVVHNHVPQLSANRITLTYPVLLNAAKIIVLARGESKVTIVNELYSGTSPGYPMLKIVNEHKNLQWFLGK